MIIEFEINGARVIVSGDNLSVNVSGETVLPIEQPLRSEGLRGGIVALRDWLNVSRGRASQLAEDLGITRTAIPQWREVPADRLLAVEALTGIKRQVLRPDLFEGMSA